MHDAPVLRDFQIRWNDLVEKDQTDYAQRQGYEPADIGDRSRDAANISRNGSQGYGCKPPVEIMSAVEESGQVAEQEGGDENADDRTEQDEYHSARAGWLSEHRMTSEEPAEDGRQQD